MTRETTPIEQQNEVSQAVMGIHKIKSVFRLTLGLLAVFIAVYALAQGNQQERFFQGGTLPEADGFVHMGVATCASSVCHGQPSASEQDNVLMTEYRTWLNQDLHSRAYNSLLTPASRLMAENLGLEQPPHRAKICLDCHTDNVPESLRGEEFLLSDGVGCEACHGGSENWLDSHRENSTHQDNISRGLFPTENPFAQATLCLSCHNGSDTKLASHLIMGAGHPRLSFELEAYSALQPAHYRVDEDYRERKNALVGLGVWITGQLEMAMQSLELINTYVVDNDSMQSELYFYDCQACHHPLEDKRWIPGQHANLPPGTIRLNDSSFQMVTSLLEVVSIDRVPEMNRLLNLLHQASVVSKPAIRNAAENLHAYIEGISLQFSTREYTGDELRRIRRNLIQHAANGDYRDYAVAEQALMAIDGITIRLQQADQYESVLDALFQAMVLEDFGERGFVLFNADRFVRIARQVDQYFADDSSN